MPKFTPGILIFFYLLIINIAAFLMMGLDKRRAQKNRLRIPESTLFLVAVLGGSIGGILGMYQFRHKTNHWQFRLGFPAILILQLAGVVAYWWFFM